MRWRDDHQTARALTWAIRVLAYPVLGAVLFTELPHGSGGRPVLIGCYVVVGLAMAAWVLVGTVPALAPRRAAWCPFILGVIAAAGGFGSSPRHADLMVAFTLMAALSAGSDLSIRAGWMVAAAGGVGLEIGGLAYGDGVGSLFGYPLLVVVAILMGHTRRAYRVQAEQSAALLAQAERLQAQERRADVLDERARIAREIHDVLAHSLGGLGIQIQVARAVLTDKQDVDHALDVLASAQRMASDGLVETRRAVQALRSDTLRLDEQLVTIAETHGKRYGSEITVDIAGEPGQLPPAATMALLRILQEALVNATKHAPGQPVAVHLDYGEQRIGLTVTNSLAECSEATDLDLHTADSGYGLTGMQERLLLLGGSLTAGPEDGGWRVSAELPRETPRDAEREEHESGRIAP